MKYIPNNTEINIRLSWAIKCAIQTFPLAYSPTVSEVESKALEYVELLKKMREDVINEESKKHEMKEKHFDVSDHVDG